jgi:hypothetical protein
MYRDISLGLVIKAMARQRKNDKREAKCPKAQGHFDNCEHAKKL